MNLPYPTYWANTPEGYKQIYRMADRDDVEAGIEVKMPPPPPYKPIPVDWKAAPTRGFIAEIMNP